MAKAEGRDLLESTDLLYVHSFRVMSVSVVYLVPLLLFVFFNFMMMMMMIFVILLFSLLLLLLLF